MNIQQTIISSYHHQSNAQVEACIKFVKHTITNVLILTRISDFQIESIPVGSGLPNPTTMLFNMLLKSPP